MHIPINTQGVDQSQVNITAEAFAQGLDAFRVAAGGVDGGNIGLTTQAVFDTTDGKANLSSLGDGNVVEIYASGADLSNNIVKSRVFLSKGEIHIEDGLQAGAIIKSTQGVSGVSGCGNAGTTNVSPFPLGLEGYAGRLFYVFAFRNSQHGQNRTAKNITSIVDNGSGFPLVTFDAPHGFQTGTNQEGYIEGTTNYNGQDQFGYVSDTQVVMEDPYVSDEFTGTFYGCDIGIVYVNAGAVASEVQLLSGDGQTVIDSASLDAFGAAKLYTDANTEYQVVATQPVFVGVSARQGFESTGVPAQNWFYDTRLATPMNFAATELMVQNRNARLSALYDNTEVWWYRQNGQVGKVTLSPGSPVTIYTGTINELGEVFYIEPNATPATAGTFDISLNANNTFNQPSGTFATNNEFDGEDFSFFCTVTTPASAPTSTTGEVIWTFGSAFGISLILNSSNQLELYYGAESLTPALTSAALSTSTQYSIVVKVVAGESVELHYQTGTSFSTINRTPENTGVVSNSDYSNGNGGAYGQVNASGNIGAYSGTPSGTTTFQGTLDTNVVAKIGVDFPAYSGTYTATITYNAGLSDIKTAFESIGLGKKAIKIDFNRGLNLSEQGSRVYLFLLDPFKRQDNNVLIDTSGLTGNAHTLTIFQTGTAVDNAASNQNYQKEGILRLVANAPISCLSGADGSGLEATYATPVSFLTQRMGLPLGSDAATSGASSSIQIQSPFKGTAKIFSSDNELLYQFDYDRDSSLADPYCEFEQRFPCGFNIGGTTSTQDLDFDGDFLGGYVETSTPSVVILNSTDSQDHITPANGFNSVGSETNGDETVMCGITPSEIRAEIEKGLNGIFYKRVITGLDDSNPEQGFIDYNDTTGGIAITADTWTTIPNDGAGAFSNSSYAPSGVTQLMDTTTGEIDPRELGLGDTIIIRNDFTVNPNTNNALLEFRYVLGGGAGEYTLQTTIGRLDDGSGVDYRFSLKPDLIYMGDTNTRDNLITLQVRLSANGTLTNAGSVIQVIKKNVHGNEKWVKA